MKTKRAEFLDYFFSIIFRFIKSPEKLRKLIWNSTNPPRLKISLTSKSQGILYINILDSWRFGCPEGQVVRVTLNVTTVLGDVKQVERLLKVKICSKTLQGICQISKIDSFNFFKATPIKEVTIDNIVPYFALRGQKLEILENLRFSRIRECDVANKIRLGKEHIEKFGMEPRIFYKNDVVQLEHRDGIEGTVVKLYYKVDFQQSTPCIVNSTTSIYETTSTSTSLPFSNFTLTIPLSTHTLQIHQRLHDIYHAHKQLANTPLVIQLNGVSGSGKRLIARVFASATHRNFMEVDAYSLIADNPATTETKISAIFERAASFWPCVVYLRNADVLAYDMYNGIDRRLLHHLETKLQEPSKTTVILSCISQRLSQMPAQIKSLALYTFQTEYLEENDRIEYLTHFLKNQEKLVHHVAKKTSGFTLAELEQLLKSSKSSFDEAIDRRNANFADAIGAPKIPNVKWSDVGGLEETKRTVAESIRTNLFGNRALKRSGIILYGLPGCGKTLIAKAVATEFNIAFLSVKGPELLNKYVGQSEENLRKVFERAKQASPCVIFFDEIDSLAPNRGKNGDSGGVIDRIVSQLLAELDKLHNCPKKTKIFVMGATNRPDLLDDSLMRPGRFDKMVEVKPGSDRESKTKILEAISNKMKFEKDVDMGEIADLVSPTMSGAQLFSIISNAAMQAIIEKINLGRTDDDVRISQKHLIQSVDNFHNKKL